ncbi:MAG: MotA/TolQ/ExbB proton channel family protein [Bacteroidota bacterium]
MEVAGETAAETPAKTVELSQEISAFEFLMKGGVFLIPIAILLFYTLIVTFEKVRYLRRMTKYNDHLVQDIKPALNAGNISQAIETVSRDTTAYGSVLKEGLLTVGRPIPEIESNMEKRANIEIGKMERNMGHLGLIAGIAPTLGFIGTISGVIKIFYSISITENVSIGNISGGLYEKMISSGSGLVVGIIAFAAYHLLNGIIDSYTLKVQQQNLDFISSIQRPNQ